MGYPNMFFFLISLKKITKKLKNYISKVLTRCTNSYWKMDKHKMFCLLVNFGTIVKKPQDWYISSKKNNNFTYYSKTIKLKMYA